MICVNNCFSITGDYGVAAKKLIFPVMNNQFIVFESNEHFSTSTEGSLRNGIKTSVIGDGIVLTHKTHNIGRKYLYCNPRCQVILFDVPLVHRYFLRGCMGHAISSAAQPAQGLRLKGFYIVIKPAV